MKEFCYDVPDENQPRVAEWPPVFEPFASRARLTPAPRIGQHSREVLAEHGLDAAEIDALIQDGVVRQDVASCPGRVPAKPEASS
jgi:crotonobetainyl-CoA:carnitine CoA-transferase CaiB-like acyl-CoA transferase